MGNIMEAEIEKGENGSEEALSYEEEKFARFLSFTTDATGVLRPDGLAVGLMTGVEKLRRRQARKSRYKIFQIKTFNLLERPSNSVALFYHGLVFVLILTSLFLSVLVTIPEYTDDDTIHTGVYYLEVSLVVIFSVEYILRIWSCSCHGNYAGFWGKLRFIKKPYQVIDIIVIVATTVVVATSNKGEVNLLSVSMFRFLRFLQVLRILRLDRQRGAFKIVSHVIYEHRQELLTCWYMSFILLVACTFLVYLAEKSDGETAEGGELDNLGDGLYWGIITLSTVGYGDYSPKNWVAKIIVCFFAFIGTAFFALPAGILGSGFALQVAQNQKQKHFNRRRVPAALVIQYAWRAYASHPSRHSEATWIRHQEVINPPPPKEKKFSVYTKTVNSPAQTPTTGRRSMAFIRRKLNASRVQSYMEGDTLQSRRSSIGATIPTALELRDRCQSEGNLLLVSPNHVEDHQATIMSLPPQHFDEGFYDRNNDTLNERFFTQGYYNQRTSNVEIQLKPLMEKEKDCIRFIRKIKLFICIRKFKEECRPYDVKDVLEQYSSGQADLFSFFKKFQQNVEGVLGMKTYQENFAPNNSLLYRMAKMEQKVTSIDEKLDVIMHMLGNRNHSGGTNHYFQNLGGGVPGVGGGGVNNNDHFSQGTGSIDIDLPMGGSSMSSMGGSRAEYEIGIECDEEDSEKRQRGTTLERAELTRRLEMLKDEQMASDLDGRGRAESRFTVTPSFLTPDPCLMREANIDIDTPPNYAAPDRVPAKRKSPIFNTGQQHNIPTSTTSSAEDVDHHLKKFESVPNLQKEKIEFGEIRRSSSVHFDESSFVKHRSNTVPVYDEKKTDRTGACKNPYISDADSDSNSSKTSSPNIRDADTNSTPSTSPPREQINITIDDNNHIKHNNFTTPPPSSSSNSRTSILKRKESDGNNKQMKPAGSDSMLTDFRPSNEPAHENNLGNGHLSKSAFELNC